MAQMLEASSQFLYAGTAREGAGEAPPPDTQEWNWRRLSEDEQVAVNAAHARERVAEAGLLAGLIR